MRTALIVCCTVLVCGALLFSRGRRGSRGGLHGQLERGQRVPRHAARPDRGSDDHHRSLHPDHADSGQLQGLQGTTTAAHASTARSPPVGDPVAGVITAMPSFPNFPLGVTSGIRPDVRHRPALLQPGLPRRFHPCSAMAINSFLANLDQGKTYLNIHTSSFGGRRDPAGLLAVPEPSSLVLAGIATVGLLRRRRPRQPTGALGHRRDDHLSTRHGRACRRLRSRGGDRPRLPRRAPRATSSPARLARRGGRRGFVCEVMLTDNEVGSPKQTKGWPGSSRSPGWVNHYARARSPGRGFGAITSRAATGESAELRLWAFGTNAPAIAFYEHRGFRIIHRTDGSETRRNGRMRDGMETIERRDAEVTGLAQRRNATFPFRRLAHRLLERQPAIVDLVALGRLRTAQRGRRGSRHNRPVRASVDCRRRDAAAQAEISDPPGNRRRCRSGRQLSRRRRRRRTPRRRSRACSRGFALDDD